MDRTGFFLSGNAQGSDSGAGSFGALRGGHRIRRRAVWTSGVIVLSALAGYPAAALPVFRGVLQSYYDLDLARLGLLYGVGMLPAAGASLLAGFQMIRVGPFKILRYAVFGMAAGAAMAAMGRHYVMMLSAMAVLASSATVLSLVVGPAYLVRLFPRFERRILTLLLVSGSLTAMLYPLLGEVLLNLHDRMGISFGFVLHVPFAILAVIFLTAGLRMRARRGLGGAPRREASIGSFSIRGLPGSAWLLVALMTLHGVCDITVYMWLPRVLESGSFAEHPIKPGYALAGGALCYLISRGLLTILPDRMGRRSLMVLPGLLGGATLLWGLLSRSPFQLGLGYMAAAFLWSVEYPTFQAAAARVAPRRFGVLLAVVGVCTMGAVFVVGLAMGAVGQALGEARLWLILLPPAAGFVLTGIGGAYWVWRYHAATESK